MSRDNKPKPLTSDKGVPFATCEMPMLDEDMFIVDEEFDEQNLTVPFTVPEVSE